MADMQQFIQAETAKSQFQVGVNLSSSKPTKLFMPPNIRQTNETPVKNYICKSTLRGGKI